MAPLEHLAAAEGIEIAAVLTRTDAPVGRQKVLTPSPVAAAAERLGLPVLKANRVDDEVVEQLRSTGETVYKLGTIEARAEGQAQTVVV